MNPVTRVPSPWCASAPATEVGWTMACGTARIVSDVIAGRQPEISIDGLTPRPGVGG